MGDVGQFGEGLSSERGARLGRVDRQVDMEEGSSGKPTRCEPIVCLPAVGRRDGTGRHSAVRNVRTQ